MIIFVLAARLRTQIALEASAVFPRECCGLIEGVRDGTRIEAIALHPARNVAEAPDRFEIDPADQFRLLREVRARGHAIVGCYHSHPNGAAEPSARDRDGAGETGFIWLIAVPAAPAAMALSGYIFDDNGFLPISLAEPASLDPARDPRV